MMYPSGWIAFYIFCSVFSMIIGYFLWRVSPILSIVLGSMVLVGLCYLVSKWEEKWWEEVRKDLAKKDAESRIKSEK